MTTLLKEEIPDVADDETVVRHLDPDHHWDPVERRPNTGAFRSNELSVDRESMRPAEVACTYRRGYGFAALPVAVPRTELTLLVEKDPLVPDPALLLEPEPSLTYNPGHAVIYGPVSKAAARSMRDQARVLFEPGAC